MGGGGAGGDSAQAEWSPDRRHFQVNTMGHYVGHL